MALAYFAPVPAPSPGTNNTPEVRVLSAEFGDGYTQEGPDGLNNVKAIYKLKWDTLTVAQADAIEAFFVSKKGTEPFYWRPRASLDWMKFTCKEWTRDLGMPNTFSATLKQSFTLEV